MRCGAVQLWHAAGTAHVPQCPRPPAPARPPTSRPRAARANASCAEKVLLPTPPLPDSTSTMCLMGARRAAMAARSGSGPLGAVAHAAWLGQPAHAASLPARSLCVPGQSAGCDRGATGVVGCQSRAIKGSQIGGGAGALLENRRTANGCQHPQLRLTLRGVVRHRALRRFFSAHDACVALLAHNIDHRDTRHN